MYWFLELAQNVPHQSEPMTIRTVLNEAALTYPSSKFETYPSSNASPPTLPAVGQSAPLHSAHIPPGWKNQCPSVCLTQLTLSSREFHVTSVSDMGTGMMMSRVTKIWCDVQNPLSLGKSKLRSPCRRKSTWCKLPCRCANSTLLHQVATTSGANGPRSTPGHTDRALLQIFISIPSFLYFTMWTPFSIEGIRAPSLSTCNLHSWVIFPVLRAKFFGGNILTFTGSHWTCEKSALLIWLNH